MPPVILLKQGQQFGLLTVVKRAPNNANGSAMWLCQCRCGKQTIVEGRNLWARRTRSCGCLMVMVRRRAGSKLFYQTRRGRSRASVIGTQNAIWARRWK